MLALIASAVLIAYLLVPGILFKFIFSLFIPLEKFRRTRSEEFTFGAVTMLLPLTLTFIFVLNVGWFGKNFGRFRRFTPYALLAEKLLIPNISSWYVLLTTFMWPKEPERKVIVDLLTSDDHLYRGHVVGYEVDVEGNLRGLMLNEALRFDRRSYLKERDSKNSANKEHYWKKIPGKNLFVFADKLLTMNLSYSPPASSIPAILERVLKKLKIAAQVKIQSPPPTSPTR